MISLIKESLWKQFGASIDMLHNAIERCPNDRWNTKKKFLFLSYHTLIFLEYYLTFPADHNFSPALPYTENDDWEKIEGAVDDLIPAKYYTKEEILNYLHSCREKCHRRISSLDEDNVQERWIDESGRKNYSALEILLYNMRHVQHHAAQLNMMLRQEINDAPNWVGRTEDKL
jgi:hypothetical protein